MTETWIYNRITSRGKLVETSVAKLRLKARYTLWVDTPAKSLFCKIFKVRIEDVDWRKLENELYRWSKIVLAIGAILSPFILILNYLVGSK